MTESLLMKCSNVIRMEIQGRFLAGQIVLRSTYLSLFTSLVLIADIYMCLHLTKCTILI